MRRLATNDSELLALYQSGEGVWRIAKRYGVSHMTICRRLRSLCDEMRPSTPHCYAAQKSYRGIRAAVSMSRRGSGWTLRPNGDRWSNILQETPASLPAPRQSGSGSEAGAQG